MGEEVDRAGFHAEAPKGWQRIEEFLLQSHIVLRETTSIGPRDTSDNGNTTLLHRNVELKLAGSNAMITSLIEQDYPEPVPRHVVNCQNPDYGFEIRRESVSDAWSTSRLEYPTGNASETARRLERRALMFVLGVYDVALKELVEDSGFKLTDATSVETSDGRQVEVTFTFEPSTAKRSRLRGGVVRFDPNLQWALVNARLNIAQGESTQPLDLSITYTSDPSGLPVPARWESSFDRPDATHQRIVQEVVSFDRDPIPESEFRLSAFGLPEPATASATRARWWWVLIAAGLGMLLVAGILRRLTGAKSQ